jgi:hypothetical protein
MRVHPHDRKNKTQEEKQQEKGEYDLTLSYSVKPLPKRLCNISSIDQSNR